jgi:hypothetical protein
MTGSEKKLKNFSYVWQSLDQDSDLGSAEFEE